MNDKIQERGQYRDDKPTVAFETSHESDVSASVMETERGDLDDAGDRAMAPADPGSRSRRRNGLWHRAVRRIERSLAAAHSKVAPYRAVEWVVEYNHARDGTVARRKYALTRVGPAEGFGLASRTSARIGDFSIIEGTPKVEAGKDLLAVPTDRHIHAALFGGDGSVVPHSVTRSLFDPRDWHGPDPIRPDGHDFVQENRPSVYLGYLFSHFGHFITEAMSRSYIAEQIDPRRFNFVFHAAPGTRLQPFMVEMMSLFGIPVENVSLCDRPTRFAEILVPEQAIVHKHSLWSCLSDYAGRCGAAIERGQKDIDPEQPVYFSKQKFSHSRGIQNEDTLVEALRAKGVRILYPETMTVTERVSIYNRCRTFIGPRSSAFQLNLFSGGPVHQVYIDGLLDKRFVMLDAAKGNRSTWIYAKVRKGSLDSPNQNELELDPRRLIESLDGIAW